MALKTIIAYYESGKNKQKVFVYTDKNGSWYVPFGGTIVFHTEDTLVDDVNIEELNDDAEFGYDSIYSEEGLYEAIIDEI